MLNSATMFYYCGVSISFQLKELYILLNENYVEDDDNMFRFDYSPEFLRWALQPPGRFFFVSILITFKVFHYIWHPSFDRFIVECVFKVF